MGRGQGDDGVEKSNKKGRSNDVLQPFRVSLFERHHARLISDAINTVNVFSKTNTLSEDFVHCLPRDGSFPNLKKSQFCNFSPHFHPHALPHEPPTFSPFQGLTSTRENPIVGPHELPSVHPFRGLLRLRHSRSSSLTFSPSAALSGG